MRPSTITARQWMILGERALLQRTVYSTKNILYLWKTVDKSEVFRLVFLPVTDEEDITNSFSGAVEVSILIMVFIHFNAFYLFHLHCIPETIMQAEHSNPVFLMIHLTHESFNMISQRYR